MRFRTLSVAIAASLCLAAFDLPAQAEDGASPDAVHYAEAFDVSIEEAVNRLALQDNAGALDALLSDRERETFAGLWLTHEPEFGLTIAFTRDAASTAKAYVADTPFADLTTVRDAEYSLSELEGEARDIRGLAPIVPFDLHVNVPENRVELLVDSRSKFAEFQEMRGLDIGPNTTIVDVPSLTKPAASIHGGLALSQCTSGYSVRSASGIAQTPSHTQA